MPFSFLIPAFLGGLAALGIPLLMHLRQRERQRPQIFPSLMFLKRIPIVTSRQRRITDLPLLLLRLLVLTLLVLSFARPYRAVNDQKAGQAGDRNIVVAIDRSMSMSANGLWERTMDSVEAVLSRVVPGDRLAILSFDDEAVVEQGFSRDAAGARELLARLKPGARSTRYATALRAARELLLSDSVGTGEIILVTDLQQSGQQSAAGITMPPGFTVTTVAVPHDSLANAAIVDLDVQRVPGETRPTAIVAARVATRHLTSGRKAAYSLLVNGRVAASVNTELSREGITTVTFPQVILPLGKVRMVVGGTADALAADDSFRVVLPDESTLRVLLGVNEGRDGVLRYLTPAMAIGNDPAFRLERSAPGAITGNTLKTAAAVMLLDAPLVPAIETWVKDGGGLVLLAGNQYGNHPAGDLLPAASKEMIQRTDDRGGSFGQVVLEHPIFAPFRAGSNAALAGPRFFRYPKLLPTADAEVIARFDDGNPAVVERKVGLGRIVMVAVPFDIADGDFPLQGGSYLPFLRQLIRYAAGETAAPLSRITGEAWAPAATTRDPALQTPSGDLLRPQTSAKQALTLERPGFYQVHSGAATGEPVDYIAVNTPPAESDLTPMEAGEILVGVGSDSAAAGLLAAEAPREMEARQRWWRNLLILAAVLLLVETFIASRGWRGTADELPDGPTAERASS